MAYTPILLGTPPAGTDGDSVAAAFNKVNTMFDELYNGAGGGGGGGVDLTVINDEIAALQLADTTEAATREAADTDLRSYIDEQIATVTAGTPTGGATEDELNAEITNRTNADNDLRAYVDQQIADIEISGGASFKAVGTGSVTRTLNAKLSDYPVNVLDFYNSTTDGGNYSPAFKRATDAGYLRVDLPPKTITCNTAITPVEQMHIEGIHRPIGGSACTVVAPNGFILSPGTGAGSRIHFTMKNFTISAGSTGAAASLVKGPIGGVFDGVEFKGTATHGIESNSSFLFQIYRCRFNGTFTGSGIIVADFNGCRVQDCYFNVGVHNHIDTTLDPGVGDFTAGFPIILCGNNHNMGSTTASNRTGCRLRGRVSIMDCYFEDESAAGTASGNVFVDFIANKFDAGGLIMMNNEMNGLTHSQHCVIIRGQSSPVRCNGVIAYNRMGGCTGTSPQIHFGDINATTNAKVEGMMIHDNVDTARNVAKIENGAPYRPLAHSEEVLATPKSIAGSTFINIPIAGVVVTDNRGMLSAGKYQIDKSGYWRISCHLTAICTGSTDYANVNAGIFLNGTQIEFGNASLNAISGKKVSEIITMETLQKFAGGDLITIQARNGESIGQYSFTAQYISEEGWN
jgi:hypothetical protein